MKLNEKQVAQIDVFLQNQYSLEYEDVRNEVLDHIACEIEEKMYEGTFFEEAFKVTFSKWNKDLKASDWAGFTKVPRFIARPMIKQDLYFQIIAIVCICIGIFGLNLVEWNPMNIKGNFLLIILSVSMNILVLIRNKEVKSFKIAYYKFQLRSLNILNLAIVMLFGIALWYTREIAINQYYIYSAISFCTMLVFFYNAYYCYRFNKEKLRLAQYKIN